MAKRDPSEKAIQLILVGCGNIGSALLKGWLESGYDPEEIAVVEPNQKARDQIPKKQSLHIFENNKQIPESVNVRVVVNAVGNWALTEVLQRYRRHTDADGLMVAVTTGKTMDFYEKHLGQRAAIVRAIPSIASEIGFGTTVAISNVNVSADDRALCDQLFSSLGDLIWLTKERDMHTAGALSGVSSLFAFAMADSLSKVGSEFGLSHELTTRISGSAIAGAGALIREKQGTLLSLSKKVSAAESPNMQAIKASLDDDVFSAMVANAFKAARQRSREMSLGPF